MSERTVTALVKASTYQRGMWQLWLRNDQISSCMFLQEDADRAHLESIARTAVQACVADAVVVVDLAAAVLEDLALWKTMKLQAVPRQPGVYDGRIAELEELLADAPLAGAPEVRT